MLKTVPHMCFCIAFAALIVQMAYYNGLFMLLTHSNTWHILPEKPVALRLDSDVHYQIYTKEGEEEFNQLLPAGGHLVHLPVTTKNGSEMRPYTVMMFHQLRCLSLIREEYIMLPSQSSQSSALARHCLNYLRQSLLCHPDLTLESVRDAGGRSAATTREYESNCNDWTTLYEDAEKNHLAYSAQT